MFLRAEGVTLEFPLARGSVGHAPLPDAEAGAPLGGHIHVVGGRAWVRAIDDVSLALESGDRLALVGHNGSGKSSLLRLLAGIYQPDAGRVVASDPVSGIFNMSLGLRQEATGYRNLVLKGLMAGRSRAEVDALLPGIAEFTGLGPYLDMPLQTYSQGMAMRLAFAATTALSDDILVMDEWIGAGDAAFQERIVERMNHVLNRSRILVVASHSNALLRRVANRAIWLEQGRIRMSGTVADVLDAYEESTHPTVLPDGVAEALRASEGLWWVDEPALLPAPHLFWNLRGVNGELHLYVLAKDGTRRVVRSPLKRNGIWAAPPWVQPKVVFEIATSDTGPAIARCVVPAKAPA